MCLFLYLKAIVSGCLMTMMRWRETLFFHVMGEPRRDRGQLIELMKLLTPLRNLRVLTQLTKVKSSRMKWKIWATLSRLGTVFY